MIDKNTWDKLSIYESTDMVRELSVSLFNRQFNREKATEVVSHFSQSREYFQSAESAGVLVRPLLQYYGVLSLSRGLILFKNFNSREATLNQSHGLSAKSWGDILASGVKNLLNIEIHATGGGTLSQLIAVQKTSKIFIDNANYNLGKGTMPILLYDILWSGEFSLSLDDLLARIPEIDELYLKITGKDSGCRMSRLSVSSFDEKLIAKAALIIKSDEDSNIDLASLKELYTLPDAVESYHNAQWFDGHDYLRMLGIRFNNVHFSDLRDILESMENTHKYGSSANKRERMYLINPFDDGVKISKITKLFCLSYFLGMLSRYNPTAQMSLMNRQAGDKYLPLIRSSSEIIQNVYPSLILEELSRH